MENGMPVRVSVSRQEIMKNALQGVPLFLFFPLYFLRRNCFMNQKKSQKLYMIAVVAVMSALSTVLMYLQLGVPFVPGFLKFDFSELPALMTSFAISPIAGVCVSFLKNLLHLFGTTTMGVGELSNFLMSATYVFFAGLIYQKIKSRKGALLGSAIGTLASAIISFPVNYFITYPVFFVIFAPKDAILGAYSALIPFIDSLPEALLVVNMPLTAAKGIVCAAIAFLIYKPLSPILKGKWAKKS
jgi:riboflavin transporter FmnP